MAFVYGETLGTLMMLLLVAYGVMAVNRKRLENPTPYVAAGALVLLLGGATASQEENSGPAMVSVFIIWCFLLWRFKRNAKVNPSGLGRINAVWLSILLVIAVWTLGYSGDRSMAPAAAWVGVFSMTVGLLWKWVRLVPLTQR